MASLKEEARRWFEDFQDGIGWMLVWKTGRSWNITRLSWTDFIPGRSYPHRSSKWEIEEREDAETIAAAMAADPKAMVINGYYDNLGDLEEMTLSSLIEKLKWQYDLSKGIGEELMTVVNAVLEATDEDSQEDSQEDDQEADGMLARAMAKAAHEDEMLNGSDPMIAAAADEYDPLDDSNLMVVSPSLFKIPKYILPDPVGFQLSLCDQVDAILKEA